MVTESMNVDASKGHTVMVYPANGAMGYDMCRDLVQGDKKDMCKEVFAVCCTSESKCMDKLKALKHVKVVVIDEPTRMDSWKKHLKDRMDCCMILCDPSAMHHHDKEGRMMDQACTDMAKSMECCVEMAQHLNCKHMVVTTAFCAEDSRYKLWHCVYSAVETAMKKHFKGERAAIFCQPMFEMLRVCREEIKTQKMLSLPVKGDKVFCPLSMCDTSCASIAAMCNMMKEAAKHGKSYYITGSDELSSNHMVEMMSKDLNTLIKFNQVTNAEWREKVKGTLSSFEIECFLEIFQMMEHDKLKKCTDDCKKLVGKAPERFEQWMHQHQNDFMPGKM